MQDPGPPLGSHAADAVQKRTNQRDGQIHRVPEAYGPPITAAKYTRFTAGWQRSNPMAVLHHPVFQPDPVQLFKQGAAEEKEGEKGRRPVDAVDR